MFVTIYHRLGEGEGGFKSNSCLTNSPPLAMTPPLLDATKADKSRFKYTLAFYQVYKDLAAQTIACKRQLKTNANESSRLCSLFTF